MHTNLNQGARRIAFGLTLVVMAALWLASDQKPLSAGTAQQSQPAQAAPQTAAQTGEKTIDQTHKNIQVLKGVPDSQLRPVMNLVSASLGVDCTFCHVRENNEFVWDKDDKKPKQTARKMMQMTLDLNKASFEGRPEVTCYTCHQGHENPTAVPTLPRARAAAPRPGPPPGGAAPGGAPPARPGQPGGAPGGAQPAQPGQPGGTGPAAGITPAQVVEKYVQAIGGKEAVAKVKTRVLKGDQVLPNGQTVPVEVWFGAPDKVALSITPQQAQFAMSVAVTGDSGWVKNAREQRALDPAELARYKSIAAAFDVIALKEPYPRMTFGGKTKIADRDVNVLRVVLPDRRRAQLFFDAETGLLVRRIVVNNTIFGPDPEQTDYEDYRDVEGVKVAFTVKTYALDGQYNAVRKFTEIKHNAPVDDAKFTAPPPKQ
ncbi:MAG TPA: c-type cytochrome [Blastocatellia bacterium]|nr:c-type cytochrome [Blastocatellia bacterium]